MFSRIKDLFLDIWSEEIRDWILSINRFRIFKGKTEDKTPILVQLVDGRDYQGGLTDRLKGIVSAFCVAQIKKRPFKILHTSPFQLADYLEPNEIDWNLKEGRGLSCNIFQARLFHFTMRDTKVLRRITTPTNILQMHCYCKGELYRYLKNVEGGAFDWGEEFHRLFRPSPILQSSIDYCKMAINGEYIAIVFRFQNLLGDFEEYFYKEADTETQDRLMSVCSNAILSIQKNEVIKKVLVTSDSMRFIEHIKSIPDVYAFPGKIVHMDWSKGENYETYLKSFVDFYLIGGATKVFSVGTDKMYKSDFPKYAAMIGKIAFERILLTD